MHNVRTVIATECWEAKHDVKWLMMPKSLNSERGKKKSDLNSEHWTDQVDDLKAQVRSCRIFQQR